MWGSLFVRQLQPTAPGFPRHYGSFLKRYSTIFRCGWVSNVGNTVLQNTHSKDLYSTGPARLRPSKGRRLLVDHSRLVYYLFSSLFYHLPLTIAMALQPMYPFLLPHQSLFSISHLLFFRFLIFYLPCEPSCFSHRLLVIHPGQPRPARRETVTTHTSKHLKPERLRIVIPSQTADGTSTTDS